MTYYVSGGTLYPIVVVFVDFFYPSLFPTLTLYTQRLQGE